MMTFLEHVKPFFVVVADNTTCKLILSLFLMQTAKYFL